MATRSYIVIKLTDAEKQKYNTKEDYMGVYCHYDGYKSYNGRVLMQNYNTRAKAKDLIRRGYMSSLKPTTKETTFYCRDWKRKKQIDFFSNMQFEFTDTMVAFVYLFINNQWHYARTNRKLIFRPLTMRNTVPSKD